MGGELVRCNGEYSTGLLELIDRVSVPVLLDNDTLRVDRNEACLSDRTRCKWAITQRWTSLPIQRMRYKFS